MPNRRCRRTCVRRKIYCRMGRYSRESGGVTGAVVAVRATTFDFARRFPAWSLRRLDRDGTEDFPVYGDPVAAGEGIEGLPGKLQST